jgi:neutral ceramidase
MSHLSRRVFLQASTLSGLAAPALLAQTPVIHAAQKDDTLQAGVAVRDITPAPGAPLWGYSDAERIGASTLDPLHARALCLRSGSLTIGLVTLDLGRVPLAEVRQRLRQRAEAAGIDHLILAASHTHSAPVIESPDATYMEGIEAGIGEAIAASAKNLQPVQLAVGRAPLDIAHNRRLIKDGTCYMLWRNAERNPTAPIDPEAGIIRLLTANNKPLATLVHYACHPVVFGPDNRQYSADWAGEMCRVVKEDTGAECFFLQGACGDINPYLDKTPLADGAIDAMRGEGQKAARAVLSALKSIQPDAPEKTSLAYTSEEIEVGLRWDLSKPDQQAIIEAVYGDALKSHAHSLTPDLSVPLAVLTLNNEVALPFMSGEMFIEFQRDLKRNSCVPHTFLCGYANDFHAYFPTIHGAALGSYGGLTASYVGLGAGEKLCTAAKIRIGEQTGQLGPLTGPEDFQVLEA